MDEPTSDQCSANAPVDLGNGLPAFAAWYPQMGGYVGRAVVVLPKPPTEDCCVEVYVWHDGDFPFSEGRPALLHHCSAEQFIRFGELLQRAQRGELGSTPDGTREDDEWLSRQY